MTSVPAYTNGANPKTIGLKVQPASDASGDYVAVVALDSEEISIGAVSQEGTWNINANAGTNLNTSALALETGGNLSTLAGAVSGGKVQTSIVTPLPAGTNLVGKIGIDQTTPGTTNKVSIGSDGTVALAAGTNSIGGVSPAPTASSNFAITPGSSSTLEVGHVLKASAGNLYSLYIMTTSVGGYLMTFNATSVPADGAVNPVECIQIPAGSAAAISFDGAPPDYYSTGIVAVFSSTGPFTKTASATAFFKWRVE